jgi:hypothetical protein
LYPADAWAGISIGSFIFFLGLLGLFIFSRSSSLKRFSFWFGILAIAVSGFTFSFAARQKEKINQRKHAIVFCPRVTVKSAPAAKQHRFVPAYTKELKWKSRTVLTPGKKSGFPTEM